MQQESSVQQKEDIYTCCIICNDMIMICNVVMINIILL